MKGTCNAFIISSRQRGFSYILRYLLIQKLPCTGGYKTLEIIKVMKACAKILENRGRRMDEIIVGSPDLRDVSYIRYRIQHFSQRSTAFILIIANS